MDRAAQVRKYRGERCCVCGKWGAQPAFGEPIAALKSEARTIGLTLTLPGASDVATHSKCLRQLKTYIQIKRQ